MTKPFFHNRFKFLWSYTLNIHSFLHEKTWMLSANKKLSIPVTISDFNQGKDNISCIESSNLVMPLGNPMGNNAPTDKNELLRPEGVNTTWIQHYPSVPVLITENDTFYNCLEHMFLEIGKSVIPHRQFKSMTLWRGKWL